jgi:membrane AbrB-like protein
MTAAPVTANRFTLEGRHAVHQWAVLIAGTLLFVWLFRLIELPAALLLGAIVAAGLLASFEGRVPVPRWSFVLAQAVIGCLVAKAIGSAGSLVAVKQWPIFIFGIGSVMALSVGLGVLLARFQLLPGTTGIWGSSPGAATAMVLMAEAFGGDIRLVAVMQYLRVALVGLVASIVARTWAGSGAAPVATEWFPAIASGPFLGTLAVIAVGAVVGVKAKVPAGPLLVPLAAGAALSATHVLTITLPPWLLAICYAFIGWSIGLRFTRPIALYAARLLPRIAASILGLIAACGALGYVLHLVAGTDPMTAYLATSPGGADSVAIIAASSKVDMPFVMSMQIARALLALIIGPPIARFLTRWMKPSIGVLGESPLNESEAGR